MQYSDIPYKFAEVWAALASAPQYLTTPIPVTAAGGAASQAAGFPPITATDPGAGGKPPNINDFNGVLQYVTAWAQWVQAGGPITYDATFQTNIGGYPQGARVQSAVNLGQFWFSIADNNTTNPDAAGAGWIDPNQLHGELFQSAAGTYSFTVPAYIYEIYVELWGGGGGSSGGLGSSAGGGGYFAKLLSVSPGDVVSYTVGAGGTQSATVGLATDGGTTSFGAHTATGGGAGKAGPGAGGSGSGGTRNLVGGGGIDLDGVTANAPGGAGAMGGSGGIVSAGGATSQAAIPGGGGGANAAVAAGQNGAAGAVSVRW